MDKNGEAAKAANGEAEVTEAVEVTEVAPETATEAVKKGGLTTRHVVLILGLVIIIAASVIVAILLLRDTAEEPDGLPVINQANVREIQEQVRENVARGMLRTHMNMIWNFRDGASPSHNAVMGNSASNNFPFYFTITLGGTGEVIFTSGLLPLGTVIDNSDIVLGRVLPAGDYDAVVNVHMVDDDGEPVDSNMGFNITLIIES